MKNWSLKVVFVAFVSTLCLRAAESISLEARFANPPESSRLQTWWHWCADNVTREGIAADLKAMAEMDVGTAHVFSPAMMGPIPGYHAKLLTPEWKEIFATAVSEAKKCGIKLGFHNCPGWSSSGGPWIRPEDSMKVVVASEVDIRAGLASVVVPQPAAKCGFYRDLAVLAFPVPAQPEVTSISSDFSPDMSVLKTGSGSVSMPLSRGKSRPVSFTLEYAAPFSPTTFAIQFAESKAVLTGTVEASLDGKSWKKLRDFAFHFHADIGDAKYMSLSCAAPSRFFRVTIAPGDIPEWMGGKPFDTKLRKLAFTTVPMVANLGSRNSSTPALGYQPAAKPEQAGISKSAFRDLTTAMDARGNVTLSSLPKDGSLWRILRIGYTTSGKTCAPATLPGLECDKLSKRGLDAHWPHMPKEILSTPEAKGTVVISLIDSYEVGGQNWTEDLPAEFSIRRGYDLRPYLPAIVGYTVGTSGETAKFLFDLQRTVADLFAENYYDYFAELCHREGILAASEAYGGPFDALRCFRTADVPTGEFWLGRVAHGSPRIASSAGHVNGRSVIAAEAFTTEAMPGRWQITPRQLKESGDRGWLEGISQLVYHSYLSQPFMNVKPGLSLGRHGTQLNRHTTWWKDGRVWSAYVRRGQFLLQSGRSRADVIILSGDSNPNAQSRPSTLVKAGYNFDFCCREDLFCLETKNGLVNMPGLEPYAFLSLGTDPYLSVPVLKKVKALLDAGARVAARRPLESPTLSDDPNVWKTLVNEIWGTGRANLVETTDLLVAAKKFGLKPPADSKGRLGAIRRRIDGRDFYFLMNDSEQAFEGSVTFAAEGAPSRWDAKTGAVTPLPRYRAEAGRVMTRLSLPPRGSVFVGFAPASADGLTDAPVEEDLRRPMQVVRATYFASDAPALSLDVTENVRRLIAAGTLDFDVGNATLGVRDPAPNHYKVLKVEFVRDGCTESCSFREHRGAALYTIEQPQTKKENVLCDLSEDWRMLSFEGSNPPSAPRQIDRLASWSESDDPKLRYFAGRAVYEKRVTVPGDAVSIELDLGNVRDLANVWCNGESLGCLWEPPYRVRVTVPASRELVLRIEVVNCWPNRMIGDAIARKKGAMEPKKNGYPEWVLADKPDSGTGIFTWSNFDYGWKATDKPIPAGLIGPVRLLRD